MAQLSNLIVNGVTRLLSKLYVSDSVTAPNFIGKLTGTAAKLGRNGDADTPMTFNWSGKDGQPTWLWGSENGSDMYVYNPLNFSVKNAKAAGSADSATKLSSSAGSATQPVYFSDGKPVATTYTLGKSVPASAVFTDTNTWRGVQNNLTSDATDQSLSAAQGKVLKGLVDGKAPSGHTHDDRYYTESEINTKLAGKADSGHIHLQGTESGKVDWNTLKTFGVYKIQSCTMTADYHAPVDEYAFGILQVLDSENGGSENRIIQIYWPHRTSQGAHLWYRMHNSSNMSDGWSNWTAITEKPATAGVADSASSVAWVNVTGKPSTFTPSSHTHNYAGSSSAGGAATSANKVNAALTINLNGTSQGAWDGSSAKSISITAASVGATSVTISRW